MNLMIVDDHAGVRKLIRQLIAGLSDNVCECSSGEEALTMTGAFGPDVVTMDLRLPGMSGLEAATGIREVYPRARIVIVSNMDGADIREAVSAAGISDYVAKENLAELRSLLMTGDADTMSQFDD